jgi:hypothetical protein
MIKGKTIRQGEETPAISYRKLDALNQSMIKLFDSDPVKFFEQFKLGKERDDDKKSVSLIIGDLVDFYLLSCKGNEDEFHNRFDEKFALFSGTKGTGQVYGLADLLFELTRRDTNKDTGKVKTSFETRFNEAVKIVQADGKYKGKTEEKVLEDFEKNGLAYFESLVNNVGRTVIDSSLVDKALYVGNRIKNDEFTREYFDFNERDMTANQLEVYTHFAVQWTYIVDAKKKIECKSEIDLLVIDHARKIIHVRDLKTTYDNESFDYMYIKNSYYLQNAFYWKAIRVWAAENGMADYEVMPLEFIVGDTSANNRRPLVYRTSIQDVKFGLHGFDLRGTHYRGIEELIDEIVWCEEKNMWDCSREAYKNMGKMQLNIKYD